MKKMTDFFKRTTEQGIQPQSTKTTSEEAQFTETAANPKEVVSDFDQADVNDGPFHPPSTFCFPKTKSGSRERSCQFTWFEKFPWLHYDSR